MGSKSLSNTGISWLKKNNSEKLWVWELVLLSLYNPRDEPGCCVNWLYYVGWHTVGAQSYLLNERTLDGRGQDFCKFGLGPFLPLCFWCVFSSAWRVSLNHKKESFFLQVKNGLISAISCVWIYSWADLFHISGGDPYLCSVGSLRLLPFTSEWLQFGPFTTH